VGLGEKIFGFLLDMQVVFNRHEVLIYHREWANSQNSVGVLMQSSVWGYV
jgi:hypothetical protein